MFNLFKDGNSSFTISKMKDPIPLPVPPAKLYKKNIPSQ
jgi:hypothetical protein